MKQRLKKLAVLSIAGLAMIQPLSASAWTTRIDCEGGGGLLTKVLENLTNTLTSVFTKTVYSNEKVATGSQSCKMGVSQGSDGWGEWGGIYQFPTKLTTGSQLWIRVSVYVPSGFNYTGSPMLKFMRVHTASPAATNLGYLDMYINPPTGTVWDSSLSKDVAAPYQFYYEGKPVPHTFGVRPTNSIATGKWETYEIHYKLDSRSKNAGGTGQVKIWKNNQLLADLPDQVTLADAQTYAESFFLFTYWNGNAPSSQSLFVDDIIITNETPANRDAKGNPYIGAPVMTGAVPAAPSGMTVQ